MRLDTKNPESNKSHARGSYRFKTSAVNAASGVAARQARMLTCFCTVVLVILTYAKIWSLCRISRSVKTYRPASDEELTNFSDSRC